MSTICRHAVGLQVIAAAADADSSPESPKNTKNRRISGVSLTQAGVTDLAQMLQMQVQASAFYPV
jgi:hypothetical protein